MEELHTGTIVGGSFAIDRLVAQGGMGSVYRARHVTDQTSVFALKVLAPEFVNSTRSIERFKNEFRAAQQINHPNVMRAHGYLCDGAVHALVLEYIEGSDLTELQRKGRLKEQAIVQILLQVADGLSAIHAAGIIHRDLKPENIILRQDGIVKISDFGVARLGGSATLTPMGGMVGTARYLPPEYLETGDCDARGDIFALGVIGYELLTRVSPFGTDDRLRTIIERHRRGVTPLRELAPEVSPKLAAVIERAMARKVTQRFLTAKEFSTALAECLE